MAYKKPFTIRQQKTQKTLVLTIVKALNISQAELGRWVGVERAMVTRWVTGKARVSARMAMKLSRLFPEITPEQLCPEVIEDSRMYRK